MKKQEKLFSLILVIVLTLFTFAGCSNSNTTQIVDNTNSAATTAFNPSDGIDDNGCWENITALDYVELCDYKSISVPSDIQVITDESIQTKIETILVDYSNNKQVKDRSVTDNDTVNIDYVGSINGVEFDGGSTDGAGTEVTIGVTEYIDDFLEQLIGHAPGESFDIEVTFPKDYGKENLNGKDATFAITINYIIEKITPELTDEFVLNNLSSNYGWIKSDLLNSATASYVQEYIVENTNIISLPEALKEYQENTMLNYYQDYASYYSMDIEEFLSSYMGIATTDELIKNNNAEITEAANLYLITQAIAEDIGISVSDEDVATYIKDSAGLDDYSQYEEEYGMPYLKFVTLNQLVIDYLVDKAVLE
jgi:trigger factor